MTTGIYKFFEDIDKWENSFECNICGELDHNNFVYDRTVANGEVWHCSNCQNEIVVNEKPNEDNY